MKSTLPVLLLLLSAGAFYFYINPGYARITGLQEEVRQHEATLADAESLGATRDSLVTTYNNFSSTDLARLEKMLPDKVDTVRLAAEINSIGQRYGITVKSFTVSEEKLPTEEEVLASPYRTLLVTFSFDGSYENFTQFLSDLESNIHIVDVSEIVFQEASTGGIQAYRINLRTYALSQ
ncbi:MAG: type 4a pilus biogenesis protein PilO [Patescibacteria group bacterium]